MTFVKPATPDAGASRPAEKPDREGRTDGQADVLDVPQADGNSTATPVDGATPADTAIPNVRMSERE